MSEFTVSPDGRSFTIGDSPKRYYATLYVKDQVQDLGRIKLEERTRFLTEVASAYLAQRTPDRPRVVIELPSRNVARVNGRDLPNSRAICSIVQNRFGLHAEPTKAVGKNRPTPGERIQVPGIDNKRNHCYANALIHFLYGRFSQSVTSQTVPHTFATDDQPEHLLLYHLRVLFDRYRAINERRAPGPISSNMVQEFLTAAEKLRAPEDRARGVLWTDYAEGHDPMELYAFLSQRVRALNGSSELAPFQREGEEENQPYLILNLANEDNTADVTEFLETRSRGVRALPAVIPIHIQRTSDSRQRATVPLEVRVGAEGRRYRLASALVYDNNHHTAYLHQKARWIRADDAVIEPVVDKKNFNRMSWLGRKASTLQYIRV